MVQAFCKGEEFSIDLICDLDGRCLEAVPRSMRRAMRCHFMVAPA